MSPVLEYRERRLGSRRDFTLGDDAVSVRGSTFLLSEFDATVPLKALLPSPSRARTRTPTFLAGFALFLFAVVLLSLFWGGPGPRQNLPLFLLGCFLTVAGLIAGLAIFRKIESSSSRTRQG